jgi:hypothetical protein
VTTPRPARAIRTAVLVAGIAVLVMVGWSSAGFATGVPSSGTPVVGGTAFRVVSGLRAVFEDPKVAPKAKPTPNKPPTPALTLSISGPEMKRPITVEASKQPKLYNQILSQVSWMDGRAGDVMPTQNPDPGPGYTVTLLSNGQATATYDLFPKAPGGPRSHRDATASAPEAWFFAPITLGSVLTAAGVNLAAGPTIPGAATPAIVISQTTESLHQIMRTSGVALILATLVAAGVLILLVFAARTSRRLDRRRTLPAAMARLQAASAAAGASPVRAAVPGQRRGRPLVGAPAGSMVPGSQLIGGSVVGWPVAGGPIAGGPIAGGSAGRKSKKRGRKKAGAGGGFLAPGPMPAGSRNGVPPVIPAWAGAGSATGVARVSGMASVGGRVTGTASVRPVDGSFVPPTSVPPAYSRPPLPAAEPPTAVVRYERVTGTARVPTSRPPLDEVSPGPATQPAMSVAPAPRRGDIDDMDGDDIDYDERPAGEGWSAEPRDDAVWEPGDTELPDTELPDTADFDGAAKPATADVIPTQGAGVPHDSPAGASAADR